MEKFLLGMVNAHNNVHTCSGYTMVEYCVSITVQTYMFGHCIALVVRYDGFNTFNYFII